MLKLGVPLDQQGLTVAGEVPVHLQTWLLAIDSAHNEVAAERQTHGAQ